MPLAMGSRRRGAIGRRSLIAGSVAIVACTPRDTEPGRVSIAPGVSFLLPAPDTLGRSIELAQLITARHGERQMTFEARLSVTPQRLLAVGTDPLGRRAFSATWNGQMLVSEQADWMPSTLQARNMIADIVLLFWPEAVLRTALGSAASLLSEPARRAISAGGREIVRIAYQPDQAQALAGRASLSNLGWGYELQVRSSIVPP